MVRIYAIVHLSMKCVFEIKSRFSYIDVVLAENNPTNVLQLKPFKGNLKIVDLCDVYIQTGIKEFHGFYCYEKLPS